MPIPWLQLVDAALGLANFARRRGKLQTDPQESPAAGAGALGQLETRLASVVVAALREAFDRDSRRLELERKQIEIQRQHAERMLKLELLRQAGDREIGRLRLVAGVAVATWIGALLFSARLLDAGVGARAMLGGGWMLLIAALGFAFAGQARVSAGLGRLDGPMPGGTELSSGAAGAVAPWLLVGGLAFIGVAMLIA